MAAPKPTAPLDVLEQMLNEVLVQTGKALRASVKDGQKRGTLLPANVGKISECNETFNVALDDLEGEIIRAKAVLRRDLEQLRASRRPAPPPIAPPAPMLLDLDSPPKQEAEEEPDSLLQLHGEPTAPPIKAEEAKAMAPFPNMGIDVSPPGASPVPPTVKEERPSPEPSPKPSPKPAVQQPKTAPARPSPKPLVAAHTNPAVTSEVKPEPKAAPAPAAVAPAPPATSNPVPPPFLAVGSKPPENVSATIIDDAPWAGNGGAEADPELNFTDMQFSLEPSLIGDSSQQNVGGSGFDLTSPPSLDVMSGLDILSLDNYSIGGPPPGSTQQQAAPAASAAATTTNAPDVAAPAAKPAEKAPALAPEPNMDDLFDLGGSSSFDNLNTDLGMGGVEGVDSSSFNELFFDDGDIEMGGLGGEFDNAYFGPE